MEAHRAESRLGLQTTVEAAESRVRVADYAKAALETLPAGADWKCRRC